jgi:hypothetical protein
MVMKRGVLARCAYGMSDFEHLFGRSALSSSVQADNRTGVGIGWILYVSTIFTDCTYSLHVAEMTTAFILTCSLSCFVDLGIRFSHILSRTSSLHVPGYAVDNNATCLKTLGDPS